MPRTHAAQCALLCEAGAVLLSGEERGTIVMTGKASEGRRGPICQTVRPQRLRLLSPWTGSLDEQ